MNSNMLNHAEIQGRITRPLELKTTNSGKSVLSFTLASERDKENTNFIDCVAWEKTAETISRFCNKGDMLIVEGMLQTRKFEDKAGNNRVVLEIVVDAFHFVPNGKKTSNFNVEPIEDEIPW